MAKESLKERLKKRKINLPFSGVIKDGILMPSVGEQKPTKKKKTKEQRRKEREFSEKFREFKET